MEETPMAKTIVTKALISRYEVGDPISNAELVALYTLYSRVVKDTTALGASFYLATAEAIRHMNNLRSRAHLRQITLPKE
jgi:hypothetical protein